MIDINREFQDIIDKSLLLMEIKEIKPENLAITRMEFKLNWIMERIVEVLNKEDNE